MEDLISSKIIKSLSFLVPTVTKSEMKEIFMVFSYLLPQMIKNI